MISIIICSKLPDAIGKLKQNIDETIGSSYELIIVDNSQGGHSIFSAYNEGLKSAKGNFLCFMHEDILFHSNDWGQKLEVYFDKFPNVGMVGVAGTHFLPKMPAAWWDTEMRSGQLLQGRTVDGVYKVVNEEWIDYRKNPTQVASVDGLWMCCRRALFDSIRWDDITFKGFHCYDTDISLQVWKAGYEVHIFWDVIIEHKSPGVANELFHQSLDTLYKKWCYALPIVKGVELTESEMRARIRIAELRHELYEKEYCLKEICRSQEYRWGQRLLHRPLLFFKNMRYFLRCMLRKT